MGYVAPNSALAQAGVQSQDVIAMINGENFADADDFFAQWNANVGKPVTLRILRGDAQNPIDITVTPTAAAGDVRNASDCAGCRGEFARCQMPGFKSAI